MPNPPLDPYGNSIPANPGPVTIVDGAGLSYPLRSTLKTTTGIGVTDNPTTNETLLSIVGGGGGVAGLAVSQGGTGAITAPLARESLGAISYSVGQDIDCFAAVGTLSTVVPVLAGRSFVNAVSMIYIVVSRAGTITTIPIFKVGTNSGHDNFSNPLTVTTTGNLSAALAGYHTAFGNTLLSSVFRPAADLSTLPMVIEMTTQAVGTGSPALVIRPVMFYVTMAIP